MSSRKQMCIIHQKIRVINPKIHKQIISLPSNGTCWKGLAHQMWSNMIWDSPSNNQCTSSCSQGHLWTSDNTDCTHKVQNCIKYPKNVSFVFRLAEGKFWNLETTNSWTIWIWTMKFCIKSPVSKVLPSTSNSTHDKLALVQ